MPDRFPAAVSHLRVLAEATALEVAVVDLRTRLADLDARVRDLLRAVASEPSDASLLDALIEVRVTLRADLAMVEAALTEATAALVAVKEP